MVTPRRKAPLKAKTNLKAKGFLGRKTKTIPIPNTAPKKGSR
jgi:hypothetical protein